MAFALPSKKPSLALRRRARCVLAWFIWTLALVLRTGAMMYLLPVKVYTNPSAADPGLQLGDLTDFLGAPVMATFGLLIVQRSATRRYGWLMLAVGFWIALMAFTANYSQYALLVTPEANLPLGLLAAWAHDLWMVNFILLFCLPFLFPDGNLPSRRWRWVFWPSVATWSLLALAYALAERPLGFETFIATGARVPNPVGIIPYWEDITRMVFVIVVPFSILGGLASLIARWKGATGEVRQQIKWVLYVLLLLLATLTVIFMDSFILNVVGFDLGLGRPLGIVLELLSVGAGVALGLAILKYRLYDIDLVINRTLVYGALVVVIMAAYVFGVAALGSLIPIQNNLFLSLVVAGILAVLFNPLRERLQHAANRLIFGQRDDPYVVLSTLGRQLSSTTVPEATLQTVVETIAVTLKLPYAAIQLKDREGFVLGAEYGAGTGNSIALPVRHQNEVVGELIVAPRSPGESLTGRDRRLLEDIVHHAGPVAQTVRLTHYLRRSRERIVSAREEERRRLRRDLHDGLGPTLASHTLRLDSAIDLVHENPDEAVARLQELKAQTQGMVADIRRLVYELRPPTLDELGLPGAVRAQVAQNHRAANGLQIDIAVDTGDLPPLPAAVEVAAYRITMEALTNVIRHAQATCCLVRFYITADEAQAALHVRINDDGQGLSGSLHAGVGMTSMRERAEELGGTLSIESNPDRGICVAASLPLPEGTVP